MRSGDGALPPKPKKADLPTKLCRVCGRPFTWRKKWARDWDRVQTCSDACRNNKSKRRPGPDRGRARQEEPGPGGKGPQSRPT